MRPLDIKRASGLIQRHVRDGLQIDHRRLHVAVAQQFLDRLQVASGQQQMARKRVPERVRGHSLRDVGLPGGPLDRLLDMGIVQVVTPLLARPADRSQGRRRKKPLADELSLALESANPTLGNNFFPAPSRS